MKKKVAPIPEGFHTITPYIIVEDGLKALELYKKALGAKVHTSCLCPETGKLVHSEVQIGDSMIMVGSEWPGKDGHGIFSPKTLKGTCVAMQLYVNNIDAFFNKAVKAGFKVLRPLADMYWGDRFGELVDPFGHRWAIAMRKEELTKKEIEERSMQCCPTPKKKAASKPASKPVSKVASKPASKVVSKAAKKPVAKKAAAKPAAKKVTKKPAAKTVAKKPAPKKKK